VDFLGEEEAASQFATKEFASTNFASEGQEICLHTTATSKPSD
jgi:hypothetical protein